MEKRQSTELLSAKLKLNMQVSHGISRISLVKDGNASGHPARVKVGMLQHTDRTSKGEQQEDQGDQEAADLT